MLPQPLILLVSLTTGFGIFTSIVADEVQPLASVTVTVYVPDWVVLILLCKESNIWIRWLLSSATNNLPKASTKIPAGAFKPVAVLLALPVALPTIIVPKVLAPTVFAG